MEKRDVLGTITRKGVGGLEGCMDARKILEVLKTGHQRKSEIHGIRTDEYVLQMENDPKHAARLTEDWIKAVNQRFIPWPSHTFDLNII